MVIRGLFRCLVLGIYALSSAQAAPTLMTSPTKKKAVLMQDMHKKSHKKGHKKTSSPKSHIMTKNAVFTEKASPPQKKTVPQKIISPSKKLAVVKKPRIKDVAAVPKNVEKVKTPVKKSPRPPLRSGYAELKLKYVTSSTFVYNEDFSGQGDHLQSRFSGEWVEFYGNCGRLMPVAKNLYLGQEISLGLSILKHNYKTGKVWPIASAKVRKIWGGAALLSFHKDYKYYMPRVKLGVVAAQWQLKAVRSQDSIKYRKETVLPGIQFSAGVIFPITPVPKNKMNLSVDFTQERYKTMKAMVKDGTGAPNHKYIIRPITNSVSVGLTYLF